MLGVSLLVFVVEARSGGRGCAEALRWIAAEGGEGHGSGADFGFGGVPKRGERLEM